MQAGHIIEFHNGTFDLPLPPKAKENPALTAKLPAAKTADDVGADPASVAANPEGKVSPVEQTSGEPAETASAEETDSDSVEPEGDAIPREPPAAEPAQSEREVQSHDTHPGPSAHPATAEPEARVASGEPKAE